MSKSTPSNSHPKVTVAMITYNQEAYIEQAIRSVIEQETNFDFELLIGEDCSTDRTREIIIELHKEYPDKIRTIFRKQNIGSMPNFLDTLTKAFAQSEYIALLEGDDYWTSPHKLQIQFDFMESHPECRLCYHARSDLYEYANYLGGGNVIIQPSTSMDISFENWLRDRDKVNIHTASMFFRTPKTQIPDWLTRIQQNGDYSLTVWLYCLGGTLAFIQNDNPMSVYRRTDTGVMGASREPLESARRRNLILRSIHDAEIVLSELPIEHTRAVVLSLFEMHLRLSKSFWLTEENEKARYHHGMTKHYAKMRPKDVFLFWFQTQKTRFRRFLNQYVPVLFRDDRFILWSLFKQK